MPSQRPEPVLTLYGRPECHLCDQARGAILKLRDEGLAFELRDVNIESDPAIHAAYLERIPVVEISKEIVSELELDIDAVRTKLGTVRA